MSAAALAQWLRDEAVTVTSAGFVTCDRKQVTQKGQQVTPQIHDLKREKGTCDLVTAVTVFSERVGKQGTESRPDQAANDAQAPAPAPAPDWRQADSSYMRHHFTCRTCCAAGHGHGTRCTAGADLWASYEAACEADQATHPKTQRRSAR